MNGSGTGLSLLVTIGIMLALGVVGAVHRSSPALGPAEKAAREFEATDPAEPETNPLHRPPTAEWDVLTACTLAPNKTDAAHHFHVKRGDDIYVFQLYFTNALEVTASRADLASHQARYFGLASQIPENRWDKALATLGEEAWRCAQAILTNHSFLVFTKWEKRPETHHYYALVLLEDQDGRRRFLQELLVEKGYAILVEPPLKSLPDGTTGPDFLEHLQNLQREAQHHRLGAWAAVRR